MTTSGMCHLSVPRFPNTHSYNSSSLAPDLAAIFQPGLISHPTPALAPEEHRMSQKVLEFLIAQQDWFMLEVPTPPTPMRNSFTQQIGSDDTDDVTIFPSSDEADEAKRKAEVKRQEEEARRREEEVKAKEAEVVKKEEEMLLERAVREFKDEVRNEEAVRSTEEIQAVKVDEKTRRKEELKKREKEFRRREEAMEREVVMERKERQKDLQREESERHWKAKQQAERKQREDRRRTREAIEQKKEEPTVIKSEKTDENCGSDVEYNGSQLKKG
jgi:hypothetical protein